MCYCISDVLICCYCCCCCAIAVCVEFLPSSSSFSYLCFGQLFGHRCCAAQCTYLWYACNRCLWLIVVVGLIGAALSRDSVGEIGQNSKKFDGVMYVQNDVIWWFWCCTVFFSNYTLNVILHNVVLAQRVFFFSHFFFHAIFVISHFHAVFFLYIF